MKRISGALIGLGLAGCVTADSDVLSGKWHFSDTLNQNLKPWGYAVVKKSDGHPVRSGEKSMRFEVRSGDCSWSSGKSSYSYYSDCEHFAERRERKQRPRSEGGSGNEIGENWYHYSIYLPHDFPVIWPVNNALGQFHDGNQAREIWNKSFQFNILKGGVYGIESYYGGSAGDDDLIHVDDMRGKWTDVLVHVNWVSSPSGFLYVYVNGDTKPSYSWTGSTRPKNDNIHFKFGIYRYGVNNIIGPVPTQIVYYDDVRKGKTCAEVTEYFPCDKIMSRSHGS